MGVLTSILDVFSGISTWFVSALQNVVTLFYAVPQGGTEPELTFIGACAIAGLGISVVMLVLNIVRNYLRFK